MSVQGWGFWRKLLQGVLGVVESGCRALIATCHLASDSSHDLSVTGRSRDPDLLSSHFFLNISLPLTAVFELILNA